MSSKTVTNSSEEFRCPVCKARQTLQPECRRCHADLSLVVKAHQRADHLYAALKEARQERDFSRQHQLTKELRLFAPGRLK